MVSMDTVSTSYMPDSNAMNFEYSATHFTQPVAASIQQKIQATIKRVKRTSSGSEETREISPEHGEGVDDMDHLSPEEKAARTKDKNKQAQKRFREKAKQRLENLKSEAVQLEASLVRVTAEKQVLELETRGLEQQVDNTIVSQQLLLPRLQLEEPAFVPSESWSSFNPAGKGGIILKALFDQPRKLTHEQALKLTLRDHCNIQREITLRAGQLLVANPEENENSLAGRKLKELLHERHGLAAYISAWVPKANHEMTSVNLTSPEESSVKPDSSFYRTVLGKLGLSERQKLALSKAFQDYNKTTIDILAERQKLQAAILDIRQPADDAAFGCPGLAHVKFTWNHQLRALQDNIDAEHLAQCVFWGTIFHIPHSLTIFQEARMMIECFPYSPDIFTILSLLTLEMGKGDAEDHPACTSNTVAISKDLTTQGEGYMSMSEKMNHVMIRSKLILHLHNAPTKILGNPYLSHGTGGGLD